MPLWEWYEMEKLVQQLYRGKVRNFAGHIFSQQLAMLSHCHYTLCCCLQVDLERARQNFKLWYGGVPRLVVERPSYSSDESRDKKQALDAIAAASVAQVCTVLAIGFSSVCG
jgi:hypothetical protein